MTKEKGALFPIYLRSFFQSGVNMDYKKEEINDDINENVENTDDEDLRRFLRGGFGAK
jgi:hypothetical protein